MYFLRVHLLDIEANISGNNRHEAKFISQNRDRSNCCL